MYEKPLVSVILPTYNRGYLIQRSIESVLQQTFTDFELLIVDDGSTDDTETVVQSINDTRVKYIKYTNNKGVSHARNIGIKNAQGEYIAFQDSDIEWYPNKLEMHIETFKTTSPDVGVVYTGHYRIKDHKKVLYVPNKKYLPMNENIQQVFLERCLVGTPTVCVKKSCLELVGGFDETLSTAEDWELFIRLSKEFKFKYIDEPSYDSDYTEDSLSSNKAGFYKALQIILEKHKDIFIVNKKTFARHLYGLGSWYYSRDKLHESKNFLLKSIQTYPYKFKYYVKYIKVHIKISRALKKRT